MGSPWIMWTNLRWSRLGCFHRTPSLLDYFSRGVFTRMLVLLGIVIFIIGFVITAISQKIGGSPKTSGMIFAISFLLMGLGFILNKEWADRATDWWRGEYPKVLSKYVQFCIKKYPWLMNYKTMRQHFKILGIVFVIMGIIMLIDMLKR